jgi:hypothetical protein
MKKITILYKDKKATAQMEDPSEWIAVAIAKNRWGLPERPELDADGNPTGVILPAEYTIEIEDITAQHELEQVMASRKAEYPSPEEFMNAYFDGGQAALDELQAQRLAVKSKYPKPQV